MLPNIFKKKELTDGEKIFNYVFSKDFDSLKDMMENRGLAFGGLRLKDLFGDVSKIKKGSCGLVLEVLEVEGVPYEEIKDPAEQALKESGFIDGDYTINIDGFGMEICLTGSGIDKFDQVSPAACSNKVSRNKILTEISCFCAYSLSFKVDDPRVLDIVLSIVSRLGVKTGSEAYFAYESDLPLDQVLEAYIYHDARTGKDYASLSYLPEMVKRIARKKSAGRREEYDEGGKKIIVFFDFENLEVTVNNRKVKFKEVKNPNKWMTKAREDTIKWIEKEAQEEKQKIRKCMSDGKNCGATAEFELYKPNHLCIGFCGSYSTDGEYSDHCRGHIEIEKKKAISSLLGSGLEGKVKVEELDKEGRSSYLRKKLDEW